ncbi:Som1p TDEL_0G04590 [Torulaspora delbrueckii]|uniref:Uncharacterized protein n=1 Tax=Torulaspora delbrueckii TaxID=4950 RepID=G8ZY59_TORDE|nr:hypothetical protein TDEL_0G04590 [Torulaspora delbrueckii]CCE93826.1 hypothetical protein TDEL_0G04590 [Torulaspora delbrueckii]
MAPPTPVLAREELPEIPQSKNCVLKSLTQFQCQLRPAGSGLYECVPFKRLFQECRDPSGRFKSRIEVTSPLTNH